MESLALYFNSQRTRMNRQNPSLCENLDFCRYDNRNCKALGLEWSYGRSSWILWRAYSCTSWSLGLRFGSSWVSCGQFSCGWTRDQSLFPILSQGMILGRSCSIDALDDLKKFHNWISVRSVSEASLIVAIAIRRETQNSLGKAMLLCRAALDEVQYSFQGF